MNSHEFPKGLEWLGSEPLSLKALRGKIILLNFWTYSCKNSLSVVEYLRYLHKQYAKKGLIIIGVHSPEFEFEQNKENVARAIKRLKISYPVVLDNEYKIWSLYDNRYWPRVITINKDGEIVHDHVGDGGGAQVEASIQEALEEVGESDMPIIKSDSMIGGKVHHRKTQQIYFGFLRAKYGNPEGYIPAHEHVFTDTGCNVEDTPYLHGHWRIEKECAMHVKALPRASEYVAIKYSSYCVSLVAGCTRGKCEIEIELDGQSLPHDMLGEDVSIVQNKAIVAIAEPRLYKIIRSDIYHKGTLKIKTDSDKLSLYTIGF
jgi:thiol-disulfide isomerase/thioredoxin